MVTELLEMRNGQSSVLVSQSFRQPVTMISARDAITSKNVGLNQRELELGLNSTSRWLTLKEHNPMSTHLGSLICYGGAVGEQQHTNRSMESLYA